MGAHLQPSAARRCLWRYRELEAALANTEGEACERQCAASQRMSHRITSIGRNPRRAFPVVRCGLRDRGGWKRSAYVSMLGMAGLRGYLVSCALCGGGRRWRLRWPRGRRLGWLWRQHGRQPIPGYGRPGGGVRPTILHPRGVLGYGVTFMMRPTTARHLLERGRPRGSPGPIALPVAGDDAKAKAVVLQLVDELGFDAVHTTSHR